MYYFGNLPPSVYVSMYIHIYIDIHMHTLLILILWKIISIASFFHRTRKQNHQTKGSMMEKYRRFEGKEWTRGRSLPVCVKCELKENVHAVQVTQPAWTCALLWSSLALGWQTHIVHMHRGRVGVWTAGSSQCWSVWGSAAKKGELTGCGGCDSERLTTRSQQGQKGIRARRGGRQQKGESFTEMWAWAGRKDCVLESVF